MVTALEAVEMSNGLSRRRGAELPLQTQGSFHFPFSVWRSLDEDEQAEEA